MEAETISLILLAKDFVESTQLPPWEVIIQSPGWLGVGGTTSQRTFLGNHKTFDPKISGKSPQKLSGQVPKIPELPNLWVEVYAEARNY